MNDYDRIGIIIFQEVEKEQNKLKAKYKDFNFNPSFKFNLAIRIKEVYDECKRDK